jgi:hypothetical protein
MATRVRWLLGLSSIRRHWDCNRSVYSVRSSVALFIQLCLGSLRHSVLFSVLSEGSASHALAQIRFGLSSALICRLLDRIPRLPELSTLQERVRVNQARQDAEARNITTQPSSRTLATT